MGNARWAHDVRLQILQPRPDRDLRARVVQDDTGGVDEFMGVCEVAASPTAGGPDTGKSPSAAVVLATALPSGICAWRTILSGWANASWTTIGGQLPPTRLK